MKGITVIALSLGLASTPLAFANQGQPADAKAKPQAMKMSDAQLDKVTAGALLNLFAADLVDIRNVQVAVPVNAGVAATVLGGIANAEATQPGRIGQRN